MAEAKDKKSPEKQADERAMRDLRAAHPAEYDGYRKQHADQMKAKESKSG